MSGRSTWLNNWLDRDTTTYWCGSKRHSRRPTHSDLNDSWIPTMSRDEMITVAFILTYRGQSTTNLHYIQNILSHYKFIFKRINENCWLASENANSLQKSYELLNLCMTCVWLDDCRGPREGPCSPHGNISRELQSYFNRLLAFSSVQPSI